MLAAAHNALAGRGLAGDIRGERALVALLTTPITKYDVVTALGLSELPPLMALLRQRTHKELAARLVHTVLGQGARIQDTDKAAALFRCGAWAGSRVLAACLVHLLCTRGERGGG